MGYHAIKPKVIAVLVARAGQTVFKSEIAEATGFTETQVQSTLRRIDEQQSREGTVKVIKTIVRGNAWMYHPTLFQVNSEATSTTARAVEPVAPPVATPVPSPPKPAMTSQPSKRVFEEVGVLVNGDVLIRDEAGGLFRATGM